LSIGSLPGDNELKVKEVRAKSILNRSKIFDYCLNPYTGCQINCRYCYARLFMRRYSGHREAWGEFVDVKVNAPDLLAKQLESARMGRVWVSSVCDPYQPLEAKYGLTRKCLESLVEKQFPVSIQTKSDMVLRDLDLLERLEDVEVGFTITTDDNVVARSFEPGAPSIEDRLRALTTIRSHGIETFVFIGPVLPGDPERLIERLEGKTDRVLIDRMNYISPLRPFYHQQGLDWAATDEFFREYGNRFTGELQKRKMPFEIFF
jgi:DNA repair photolyase